jgi:hypothetical protein
MLPGDEINSVLGVLARDDARHLAVGVEADFVPIEDLICFGGDLETVVQLPGSGLRV